MWLMESRIMKGIIEVLWHCGCTVGGILLVG